MRKKKKEIEVSVFENLLSLFRAEKLFNYYNSLFRYWGNSMKDSEKKEVEDWFEALSDKEKGYVLALMKDSSDYEIDKAEEDAIDAARTASYYD